MYRILGVDGQQYGPLTAEDIRQCILENRVNAKTLLQTDGSSEWKLLGLFPEFASQIMRVPPPLPINETRASNKIVAGICGILLGALGVHKFILGYNTSGLIMLLVSVLSCFILSPIISIIGLIEGIIYLCKSDSEFIRIYVDARKEWF